MNLSLPLNTPSSGGSGSGGSASSGAVSGDYGWFTTMQDSRLVDVSKRSNGANTSRGLLYPTNLDTVPQSLMNDYIANLIGSNSQDNGIYADNDQKKKVLEQFFSTYSKLESLSVSSSSVSYETPFLTNAGSILNISAVEYDTNSFAIAYEKGTNTFIQGVQYTAGSYTFGVPVLVGVSDGFGVSIAKATTNKVVVAWGIGAGGGDFNCSTYTFVGTVATLGTTGVLFNGAGLQVKRLQQHSCTLDTNKVVFSYVLQSGNLVAFKVVDTSVGIVFGTQQSISGAYNVVNTSSLATVSTTKFIQQHILGDFTGSFSVFTVSGTTITLVGTYPYPTGSFSGVNRIGIGYIGGNRAISIRIPTVASSAIAISLFDVSGSPVLIDYLLFTAQTAVGGRIGNVCTLGSSLYVSLWDAPTLTTGTVATRFYEIKTASDKILVGEKVSINTKGKNATMQRFDFADAFIPLGGKIQYLAIKADGSGTNSNMMLGTFDTVTMNLLNTSGGDILPADVSFVIGKQIPVSYPINNPKGYFEIVNRSGATREITIQEALVLTN